MNVYPVPGLRFSNVLPDMSKSVKARSRKIDGAGLYVSVIKGG